MIQVDLKPSFSLAFVAFKQNDTQSLSDVPRSVPGLPGKTCVWNNLLYRLYRWVLRWVYPVYDLVGCLGMCPSVWTLMRWWWCFSAEAAYEEQCRLLLDKKDLMLTKYRQLLLLESMVKHALIFTSHATPCITLISLRKKWQMIYFHFI